jgi:hypothetical protein
MCKPGREIKKANSVETKNDDIKKKTNSESCQSKKEKREDLNSVASMYIGALLAAAVISILKGGFWKLIMVLGSVYLVSCVYVCYSVLTTGKQKPEFAEIVRKPKHGKKWSDYDYTSDIEKTNIFFLIWLGHMCAIIAPYEIRILQLSDDDLLDAQELNHAQVSTGWNKALEKQFKWPVYSYWQKKVWKPILFEHFEKLSTQANLALACALEAMFCWVVYVFTWNNGLIYNRMGLQTWVWSFHFLEEVEHTHISVPEMREPLNVFFRIFTLLIFDLIIVAPIMLIMTPIAAIMWFPHRVFTVNGIRELVEYLLFVIVGVPFIVMGQFCEMVLCLNWTAGSLHNLWKQWYSQNYEEDCVKENGESMFYEQMDIRAHKRASFILGKDLPIPVPKN